MRPGKCDRGGRGDRRPPPAGPFERDQLDPASRDVLLVMQAQEGNVVALARLYDLYRGQIFRICRSRVQDFHAAEDLTQEAFLRALTAIQSLDGPRLFYPWVRRIALNLTLDYLRGHTREKAVGDEIDDCLPESDREWTSEDTAIDPARLHSALGMLSSRHQAVLEQRAQGWSHARIAGAHHISVAAAKVLTLRARRRLASAYLEVGERSDEFARRETKSSALVPYSGPDRRRHRSPSGNEQSLPELVVDTQRLWALAGRNHDVLRFAVIAALRGRSSRRVPPVVHLRRADLGLAAGIAGVRPEELYRELRKEGVLRGSGPSQRHHA